MSEGRITQWEALLDLQPHQISVLQAYRQLHPWGDERADLREAIMATSVACAVSQAKVSPSKAAERVVSLSSYMSGAQEPAIKSPDTGAAMMRRTFPKRAR